MADPCPVVGHEQVRRALERELPPTPSLLLGPESVGKWLLAKWLTSRHAAWFNCSVMPSPTMDRVRELRQFLSFPPRPTTTEGVYGDWVKVVAVNLDGARSLAVQHALLKELEEPPDYARFIITASRPPLATVASRCVTWRLGQLRTEQVAQVLAAQGLSERDAAQLAPIGGGRISPAMDARERLRPARQAVLNVMKAVAGRDKDALERSVRDWGETEDWLLRELLGAAASGRPTPVFTSTERLVVGRTQARRGMALLAASGKSRPQVAVRAMAGAMMTEAGR